MSSSKPEADARLRAAIPRYVRSGVRSTHDVLRYLRRRGLSNRAAVRWVSAYEAQGVLDDRASARIWANHWARQGYAAVAIRLKLAEKEFTDAIIEHVTTRYCPPTDDEARARLLLAQRSARAGTHRATRSRLARTLASRGFDADLIERLLGESFDDPLASA